TPDGEPTSAAREGDESQPSRSSRRRHSRALGMFVGVFLLGVALVSPEQIDAAEAFASADDGGHEGSAAAEVYLSRGEGGAGAEGAPRLTGGENAPVACRTDKPL